MKVSESKIQSIVTQYGVGVESECGKLDVVLTHRPGRELSRLNKNNLQELLYDGLPNIKETHASHDYFTKYLRDHGTQVVYLKDLLYETLKFSKEARCSLIDGIVSHSHLNHSEKKATVHALRQWLHECSPRQLTEAVIAGVDFSYDELGTSDYAQTLLEAEDDNHSFIIPPLPNLLFIRDAFSIIEKYVFIWQMTKPARQNEPLLLRTIFQYHPYLSKSGLKIIQWQPTTDQDEYPTIEGGDIAYLGEGILLIGCSERTNRAGIDALARTDIFRQIIAIMIPPQRDYMHLDTILSSVGKHAFTLHGPLADKMEVFTVNNRCINNNLLSKPEWISHGCNVPKVLQKLLNDPNLIFYDAQDEQTSIYDQSQCCHNVVVIDDYHVISYKGDNRDSGIVRQMIKSNACTIGQIPFEGLSVGGGGPHCMTNAIRRRAK